MAMASLYFVQCSSRKLHLESRTKLPTANRSRVIMHVKKFWTGQWGVIDPFNNFPFVKFDHTKFGYCSSYRVSACRSPKFRGRWGLALWEGRGWPLETRHSPVSVTVPNLVALAQTDRRRQGGTNLEKQRLRCVSGWPCRNTPAHTCHHVRSGRYKPNGTYEPMYSPEPRASRLSRSLKVKCRPRLPMTSY